MCRLSWFFAQLHQTVAGAIFSTGIVVSAASLVAEWENHIFLFLFTAGVLFAIAYGIQPTQAHTSQRWTKDDLPIVTLTVLSGLSAVIAYLVSFLALLTWLSPVWQVALVFIAFAIGFRGMRDSLFPPMVPVPRKEEPLPYYMAGATIKLSQEKQAEWQRIAA